MLSEFRDRLVEADAGRRVLDGILVAAREKGVLKTAGRARTRNSHFARLRPADQTIDGAKKA